MATNLFQALLTSLRPAASATGRGTPAPSASTARTATPTPGFGAGPASPGPGYQLVQTGMQPAQWTYSPEEEARLRQRAASLGLSWDDFLRRLSGADKPLAQPGARLVLPPPGQPSQPAPRPTYWEPEAPGVPKYLVPEGPMPGGGYTPGPGPLQNPILSPMPAPSAPGGWGPGAPGDIVDNRTAATALSPDVAAFSQWLASLFRQAGGGGQAAAAGPAFHFNFGGPAAPASAASNPSVNRAFYQTQRQGASVPRALPLGQAAGGGYGGARPSGLTGAPGTHGVDYLPGPTRLA